MTGTNDRQTQQITRRGFLSGTGAAALSFDGSRSRGGRRHAGEQPDQGRSHRPRRPRPDDRRHGAKAWRLRDHRRGGLLRAGRQCRRRAARRSRRRIASRACRATRRSSPPASRPSSWRRRPTASRSISRPRSKRAGTSTCAKPLGCDVPGCLRIQIRREEGDREQESVSLRFPDPHGPLLHRGRQAGASRRDRPDRPAQLRVQRRELPRSAEDRDYREPPAGADLGQ